MRLYQNISLKSILDLDTLLKHRFNLRGPGLSPTIVEGILHLMELQDLRNTLYLTFDSPVAVRSITLNNDSITRGYLDLAEHKLARAVDLHLYTHEGRKLKAYVIGEGKLFWLKDAGLKKGHRLTITCKDESNFYRLGEACGFN